jgi:hypothetical protein
MNDTTTTKTRQPRPKAAAPPLPPRTVEPEQQTSDAVYYLASAQRALDALIGRAVLIMQEIANGELIPDAAVEMPVLSRYGETVRACLEAALGEVEAYESAVARAGGDVKATAE